LTADHEPRTSTVVSRTDVYDEKIKENTNKIEKNPQLPYLAGYISHKSIRWEGNVIEILDMDTMAPRKKVPTCNCTLTVLGPILISMISDKTSLPSSTSTRQIIFFPIIGFVDPATFENQEPWLVSTNTSPSSLTLSRLNTTVASKKPPHCAIIFIK
jgi:hypothetical protein